MKKKLVVAAILALATAAYAQVGPFNLGQLGIGRNGGGGGGFQFNNGRDCIVAGSPNSRGNDDAEPRNINRAEFVYARVRYHVHNWRRGGEIPWHHDYPDGDTMFPDNLGRLTSVSTNPDQYQIVDIDSKELFKYPFVYMSEPGYLDLYPEDVKNLREYFDRGGFLLLDDFRGTEGNMAQYQNMAEQMAKVFPDRQIEAVPGSHAIFHSFYDIDPKDMVAPYFLSGESGPVEFLAIKDARDRIQVMIDFNNDISEYWQALDVGTCSLHESGRAVELGINYAVYAMSH